MYLVVQTAFLGDMILTTPLLERLSERGPVDVVATPANAALLANHRAVRDVIVYDKRGAHHGVGGLQQLADRIRFRGDGATSVLRGSQVAYMAQGSMRSATLVRWAGIPRIVGFDTSAGRWLYTERVRYDSTLHHAGRLLALAGLYEAESGVPRPTLYPGAVESATVDTLLREAGVSAANALVVLAPGSVWATKRWPGYGELAQLLCRHVGQPFTIVVIGSAQDATLSASIAADVGASASLVVDATGKLSLLGTAALMQRASVVVTNDSAPLHLASAMNTPTVALFGPTVPAFGFGPLAAAQRVVQHETLSCRPCDAHGPKECPLGHWRCMRQIEAVRVAEDVVELLRGTAHRN